MDNCRNDGGLFFYLEGISAEDGLSPASDVRDACVMDQPLRSGVAAPGWTHLVVNEDILLTKG